MPSCCKDQRALSFNFQLCHNRKMRFIFFLFLCTVCQVSCLFAVETGALKRSADQLYKAKNYAKACAAYEKAIQLDSSKGDLWADFGLCLSKLGQPERAKASGLEAIKKGNVATRLNAYYNLWKLGVSLEQPAINNCKTWITKGNSEVLTLKACKESDNCRSGTGMSIETETLIICPAPDSTPIPTNSKPARCYSDPPKNCLSIELGQSVRVYCRPGDVGGAPCGACGCNEAKDPVACESKVAECESNAESSASRACTFVAMSEKQGALRVGVVCESKALELVGGRSYPWDF